MGRDDEYIETYVLHSKEDTAICMLNYECSSPYRLYVLDFFFRQRKRQRRTHRYCRDVPLPTVPSLIAKNGRAALIHESRPRHRP